MHKYTIVYRYNVYVYTIYIYIFMSKKNLCIPNMHLYIIDVDIQIRL